jgi:hypothetical protein
MDWIPFTAIHTLRVTAPVEGQKGCLLLHQVSSHIYFIGIHSKVYQCPRFEAQKGCRRVSVILVLLYGMLYILPGAGIFELEGSNRDAIDC